MREAWRETTFGEIADFQNGYPFKPADLGAEGLPVIRIKQLLDPKEPPDRSTVNVKPRVHIDDGDLIFSWSGTLAVRLWDRGPALLNQHLFKVTERDNIDRGWLRLALDHAVEDLSQKTHGTTMRHITKAELLPEPVLLPPLVEQRRIVDLMGAADAARLFASSLARAASDASIALRQELLSRLERRVPFIDAIRLRRGYDLPNQDRRPGDVPVVASNGVVGTHANPMVVGPGIVTGRSGTIGRVFYLRDDFWPLNTTLYVEDFRGNEPRYIRHLLAQMHLEDFAGGSTVPSLNRNVLDNKRVPVPDEREQLRIADLLDAAEQTATCAEAAEARAKGLADRLRQDLLSGRHQIPASYDRLLDGAA